MFTVHSPALAVLLCTVTMLGWGSWANTQKLAKKDRWPFELYYWDYAIGIALTGLVFASTLGSLGGNGISVLANIQQASSQHILAALASGGIFNVANILLVVAIDAAGMALAFPVGVGLALVIGTVTNYVVAPKGAPAFLFSGVALIVVAMLTSAMAQRRLPSSAKTSTGRGFWFAVVAGCLMGGFYPQLIGSISPEFHSQPMRAGFLSPYAALLFFGLGVLASSLLINSVLMRAKGFSFTQYRAAAWRLHSLGILGGFIWMLALSCNIIASSVAGPAIAYALGQGATLVAAIWGVFVWREFRNASAGTWPVLWAMFAAYVGGLVLIGVATQ